MSTSQKINKIINYAVKYNEIPPDNITNNIFGKNDLYFLIYLSILVNEMESKEIQKYLIEYNNLQDVNLESINVEIMAKVYFDLLVKNYFELDNYKKSKDLKTDPLMSRFIKFSPIWVASHYEIEKYKLKHAFDEQRLDINDNDIMIYSSNNYNIVPKSLLRYYYPNMFSENNSINVLKKQSWEILGLIFTQHDFSEVADHYHEDRNLFNSTNFINIYIKYAFDNVIINKDKVSEYIIKFFEKMEGYVSEVLPHKHKIEKYIVLDQENDTIVYEIIDQNFDYDIIKSIFFDYNLNKYKINFNKSHTNSNNFFYVMLIDYFKENEHMGNLLIDAYRKNRIYYTNSFTSSNDFPFEFFQELMELIIGYKYISSFINPVIYQIFGIDSILFEFGKINFSIRYLEDVNKFKFNKITDEKLNFMYYQEINKIIYKDKVFLNTNFYEIDNL